MRRSGIDADQAVGEALQGKEATQRQLISDGNHARIADRGFDLAGEELLLRCADQ